MTDLSPVVFPTLADKRFAFLDLAAAARPYAQQTPNPCLDPIWLDGFLAGLRHQMNVDHIWGGYLEDRGVLWQGSYLHAQNAFHLGIDVDAPAGTPLTVKYPSRIVAAPIDTDRQGGWGGVLIFALDEPVGEITHYLYAHLAHDLTVRSGDAIKPGDIVGMLGTPQENGGWFTHLHLQAMTRNAWDLTQGDLRKFDGYGEKPPGGAHPLFPDPSILL